MSQNEQRPGVTDAIRARWSALAPREQLMVAIALWTVSLGLIWALGLSPAWKALREAPAKHEKLDGQLSRMQALAAQAKTIEQERSGSAPDRNTTTRLLQDSVQGLGSGAQLSLSGSQAVIRMEGVAPQVLARSLDQWRRVARVVPTGADLRWQGSGWSGTVTLAGPGLGE